MLIKESELNEPGGQKESSIMSEIVYKYAPYWPIFIFIILLFLGLGWTYLRYTTTLYSATATILIKDQYRGVGESQLTEALNPLGTSKIVENEIIVLKSESLKKEVVKKLRLYAPIYFQGRVKTKSAYSTTPFFVEANSPDKLKSRNDLTFKYDQETNKIRFQNKLFEINQWFLLGKDSIRFILNFDNEWKELNQPYYFALRNTRDAARSITVNAKPSDKVSSVIDVSAENDDPVLAADIVNTMITSYNDASIKDKNTLAQNTLAFVEKRLNYVVNELDSVEGVLEKYRTTQNVVDISNQGQFFLQNVGEVDKRLSEVELQLGILDQLDKYLISNESNTAIVPSTLGIQDPVLSQLLQKLFELESTYFTLKKSTATNNPLLTPYKDQIERLKPSIKDNIRSLRSNLQLSKNNLKNTSINYASLLKSIPQKERGLIDISRQQAIKNNIYTFLLQKREETALQFGSTVPDSRVIDYAEPNNAPVKPQPLTIYGVAILIGVIVAFAVVSIKDVFNNKILFRKEIEHFVSWPIVGEINYNKNKEAIVTGTNNRTAVSEQFRIIRSSLNYLGINKQSKKILITSSIAGEGKSFVAVNLAMSLAIADKKVVLIELDLRKPKLRTLLGIDKQTGITQLLVTAMKVQDVILQTKQNPNLYFIASGPIPPNPAELISRNKMLDVLIELENTFDYIVIDTAPVAPVTDAHILSRLCDVTLYVVRHGMTPKSYIKRLEEINKTRGLRNVNIIFNGVKTRGLGIGGQHSYGYGYGYGQEYGVENAESPKTKSPSI